MKEIVLAILVGFAVAAHAETAPTVEAPGNICSSADRQGKASEELDLKDQCFLSGGTFYRLGCYCGGTPMSPFAEACLDGKIVHDPRIVEEVRSKRKRAACLDLTSPEKLAQCLKFLQTPKNEFCNDKYCCRHFTRDLCAEMAKTSGGESFCVAFNFRCKDEGHSISLVRLKCDTTPCTYCLVESQSGEVVSCFTSEEKAPTTMRPTLPKSVEQDLFRRYRWLQCLDSAFLSDPDEPDWKLDRCCQCAMPPFPFGPVVTLDFSLYCTGKCLALGGIYLGRVDCPLGKAPPAQ